MGVLQFGRMKLDANDRIGTTGVTLAPISWCSSDTREILDSWIARWADFRGYIQLSEAPRPLASSHRFQRIESVRWNSLLELPQCCEVTDFRGIPNQTLDTINGSLRFRVGQEIRDFHSRLLS